MEEKFREYYLLVIKIITNEPDEYGRTALHHAVVDDNFVQVKLLVSLGVDVNKQIQLKETPLLLAALDNKNESRIKICKILLKAGADVNARNIQGQTSLYFLAKDGNLRIFKYFLKFQPDIHAEDNNGETLLFPAIRNSKNPKIFKMLVHFGSYVNQSEKKYRNTPLHHIGMYCTGEEQLEMAELLLKHGADPNRRNNFGETPFYYFVKYGSTKSVQSLLNDHADFKVVNNRGCNLLFPAVYNYESAEILMLLIILGLDVNQRNTAGETPLHLAASENEGGSHLKIAEILLRSGAAIDVRNKKGQTPLQLLVENGNIEILRLFLNYGADINALDDSGFNLLFRAIAWNKSPEYLQALIDGGLDVNYRNYSGSTALQSACNSSTENIKILKCLLRNGADPNIADYNGHTPLTKAVPRGLKAVIKFIMESTDLNFIHDCVNILDYNFIPQVDHLWKLILEHFAKLRSLNIPVHPDYLISISRKCELDDYFKMCTDELLLAKNTRLKNSWINFFNLLVDSRKKMKSYAGNEELIEDFQNSDCENKFPIYGAQISENVQKGLRRRQLFDESSIVLSDCLPIFSPNHLIIKDIFDCILSKKDLSKFCENY